MLVIQPDVEYKEAYVNPVGICKYQCFGGVHSHDWHIYMNIVLGK